MFSRLATPKQKKKLVDSYSRQLTEALPAFPQNCFLNKLPH